MISGKQEGIQSQSCQQKGFKITDKKITDNTNWCRQKNKKQNVPQSQGPCIKHEEKG